jgi:polysaccharide export outer membrane protein
MRKSLVFRFCLFAPVIYFSLTLFSCSSTKNIKYFQDIPDSGLLKTIPVAAYTEPTIKVDDILTVIVETVDPTATEVINIGNISLASTSTASSTGANQTNFQQPISGYLVDKNGNIEVPILGIIHVSDLTIAEAKEVVRSKASSFYKNPTVIVRNANFKITVAGEVARPSTYIFPNEKITILDALSSAGDLTIYGKRDNVLLLRQGKDGSMMEYRINLNKSNILNSPYYYLQQNDYIYVEPNKGKAAANDLSQTRNIAILSSVLSLIIIIATRVN